jgi:hypothetical protein
MSDKYTHFGKMFSNFQSHYVITRVTKKPADFVKIANTLYFIKVVGAAARISCGKLWIADSRGRAV